MSLECKICNNLYKNKVFQIKERFFGFNSEFPYFQCSNCKCLQIVEFPDNMERYYPSEYYSYSLKSLIPKSIIKNLIKKYTYKSLYLNSGIISKFLFYFYQKSKDLLLQNFSIVKLTKNLRILDVGCGSGTYLYFLKEIGFKYLLGIDSFIKKNIIYSNGLRIKKKKIENVRGKFDIIMFNHSFEHMANPFEIFRCISKLLEYNGTCIIQIPIIPCFVWNNYGINWVQIDAPRHFFIHSIKSIKILAQKFNLKILKILFNSSEFQFWGSEQYLRDIPLTSSKSFSINPQKSIFSKNEIKIFKKKTKKLNINNQGDQVIIFLKK